MAGWIDSDSPLEEGYCGCGAAHTVRLGDEDCWGTFVGFIDRDGLAWESRRERDVACSTGRYEEAWHAWNRAGGVLGREPKPEDYLYVADVHPDNRDACLARMAEAVSDRDPLMRARAAYASTVASFN